MDPLRGADYSSARPTKAQLDANGIAFCIRYMLAASKDRGKRFTPAEAAQLTSWGRKLVCNYEYATGAMAQGRPMGISQAQEWLVQAGLHRVPKGRPCYFSDDQGDTAASAVVAFLGGASDVLTPAGYGTGIYGGIRSIRAAYDAGYRWLWQTYAWSGSPTVWHPAARIRQVRNGAFPGQFDGDLDIAQADDFGQWDTTGWTPPGKVDMEPNTVIPVPAGFPAPGYIAPGSDLADILHGNYWHTLGVEKAVAKLTAAVAIVDGLGDSIKMDLAALRAAVEASDQTVSMTDAQAAQIAAAVVANHDALSESDLNAITRMVKQAMREGAGDSTDT